MSQPWGALHPNVELPLGYFGYFGDTGISDGLGRTIKVERGDGALNNPVTRSVVDTEYDVCACSPLGKVKRVSQPYAPGGPVYWTTYNYDGLGRLLSVVAPDGASTGGYAYQGRSTTVTDPAGKWKKFTTDAMGNLVQVTKLNPGGGANFETYYTYDALNNLTQVALPRNGYTQTRTFAYQGNLVTSATNPENGTTTYTYHGDGSLATRTDARAGARVQLRQLRPADAGAGDRPQPVQSVGGKRAQGVSVRHK